MQTIGERLEEARKRKGISIREAAEATKIRGDYLHKFESNQYDINLPALYVRGFLRTYAKYLRLPADKIVADYKALGLGEGRERTLSREAYGRLEIAPATSADKAAASTAAEAPPAVSSRAGARPKAAPPGPLSAGLANLDRTMLIKGGALLGGALVLVLIIVLVVRTLTGGGEPALAGPSAGSAASPAAASGQQTITLVALDTVRIKVVDETTQRELYQGTMVRGESRPIPKTGPLLLTASALESVEIEVGGRRFPTGETGYSRIRIQ